MQNDKQRARFDGIESLRAYAALAIVLFHLVGSGKATLPESLSFISQYFGLGVPLFFVVSGFSLAYGYWGRLSNEQALRDYQSGELTRAA